MLDKEESSKKVNSQINMTEDNEMINKTDGKLDDLEIIGYDPEEYAKNKYSNDKSSSDTNNVYVSSVKSQESKKFNSESESESSINSNSSESGIDKKELKITPHELIDTVNESELDKKIEIAKNPLHKESKMKTYEQVLLKEEFEMKHTGPEYYVAKAN